MVEFYIGVFAGVIASIIFYFLRFTLGSLLTLFSGLSARSIRGKWATKFSRKKKTFVESAKVSQFIHWIWGEINYPKCGRTYKFRGTVRSNVIVATYEYGGEDGAIDRGAFTLLVDNTGKKMNGKYSWTDDKTNKPEADNYEWTKIS